VANQEQLDLLRQGVEVWNAWRKTNPDVEINLNETDFVNTNLIRANLSQADLSRTDLTAANLGEADLTCASLVEADLIHANLGGANLERADLTWANLHWADLTLAKLSRASLFGTDLREADLSKANLNGANLSEANLSGVRGLKTNFASAILTGASIEDWNINGETNLENVKCEYIYLKYRRQERRPSDPNRNFEPGEFKVLVQKALNTVDLIFRNGVDWQALWMSLEKLRVEAAGAELSIQAIENKQDGAFVVRVNTPPDADKAEVEKFLKREYQIAVKTLEAKYESQFQLQGEQLAFYREELASKRQENTRLIGVIEVMAENQPSKYDMRGSTFGSFVDTAQAGSKQSSVQYITMSQDLTQAAAQIQELLTQLQKTGVTVETAQEQVATDLATQAKSNPTVMGKLVGWGQAMANKAGETTLSEVVKTVLSLSLKAAGIPLP
jgi:uncharacterized protein YjbI with pentapeptide repeats